MCSAPAHARQVALAQPPNPAAQWLTSELLPLFSCHLVPHLTDDAQATRTWLAAACPQLHPSALDSLLGIAHVLRSEFSSVEGPLDGGGDLGGSSQSIEAASHSGGLVLSARHMLRVARRAEMAAGGTEAAQRADLIEGVRRSLCAGLMSRSLEADLDDRISRVMSQQLDPGLSSARGVSLSGELYSLVPADASPAKVPLVAGALKAPSVDPSAKTILSAALAEDVVRIGRVQLPRHAPSRPELVPQISFTDNPMHLAILEEMAVDLAAGERALLLIGNQGTGKNKLADRLLQLLGREREYMQLHRDSTVQSLTVEPTLIGGEIVWRDSPLVQAVRHGRVLVVDEADKAPLEVVAILKSLLADGEMLLSDGRSITACAAPPGKAGAAEDIQIHDNFRVIALANRPGFPFLGNDFFQVAPRHITPRHSTPHHTTPHHTTPRLILARD